MMPPSRPSCGIAFGLPLHEMDTSREEHCGRSRRPGRQRDRFFSGPFCTTLAGRALLAVAVPALAACKAIRKIPRGLEQVIRKLSPEQRALIVLRPLLNHIYAGWGLGPERGQKPEPERKRKRSRSPRAEFAQEVGRLL